jgi:acyl transferase domain-containing protein
VALKRWSDAVATGDRILALIRGSAVNHDGQSNGLTAPNGAAQAQLIRQALVNARVMPEQIQYVETHGTGTVLGDPIEVMALARALGEGRSSDNPLLIGSVKTNLGHLESAAGITSLIKVILSLQHQAIPPHLHLQTPNPHISWEQLPIAIPQVLTPWPSLAGPRLAGVSSFGMSGTNVHVIVEEAPSSAEITRRPEQPLYLLTLSANCQPALQDLARQYQLYLHDNPHADLGDICFTANTGRSQFGHRLAIVTSSTQHLQQQLEGLITDQELPGVCQGHVSPSCPDYDSRLVYPCLDVGNAGGDAEIDADSQNNSHWNSVFQQLAEAYVQGASIDWSNVDQGHQRQRLELPTYPFQRSRYWIATDPSPVRQTAPRPFSQRPSLRPHLQHASVSDRLDLLVAHIQSAIAQVLKLAPHTVPSSQQGFVEMGLDSLMAVELQQMLEHSLALSLSPTLAFNYPTIERLAPHLLQQMQLEPEQNSSHFESPIVAVESEDTAVQLQTLSEVEMEALLVRKLDQLSVTH